MLLKCSARLWEAESELEHTGTFNHISLAADSIPAKEALENLVSLLEELLPEEM